MPASAFFLLGSSVLCLEAFKIHFSFFFRSDKWAFSRKKYLPSTQLLTKSQLCHCFKESEKKCNFGKILRFASKAKINLLLENLRIKWHQMILWMEEIIAKKFDFRFQNNLFYIFWDHCVCTLQKLTKTPGTKQHKGQWFVSPLDWLRNHQFSSDCFGSFWKWKKKYSIRDRVNMKICITKKFMM